MAVKTVTHLNFRGDAKAALNFYQSVFGGQLAVVTYQDAHSISDPAEAQQVMWGQVEAENGFAIMAYDVPSARAFERGVGSFFVSVRADNSEEIAIYWQKLCVGGQFVADLAPAAWSPMYGMLVDKFGITWVLDVATINPAAK